MYVPYWLSKQASRESAMDIENKKRCELIMKRKLQEREDEERMKARIWFEERKRILGY